jgi:hypothetical protein
MIITGVLAIETDTSLPIARLITTLEQLNDYIGIYSAGQTDTKCLCGTMQRKHPTGAVKCLCFSKPFSEVREKAEDWMVDYNYHRLHHALNFKTPGGFVGGINDLKFYF